MQQTKENSSYINGSSDRSFGFVFTVVFLIVAIYPLVSGKPIRLWAMVLAGTLIILSLCVPKILNPANRLWTQFGELLHAIVSPVALGILFYLVVTPTGLLMRVLGKKTLCLGFDPVTSSYWIKREPPGPTADSLNNQF